MVYIAIKFQVKQSSIIPMANKKKIEKHEM